MENAIGIVCEYNPLHAGHLWQLETLRARFPLRPLVLVMSGNFVQRAEAAACDVYSRARAAVECGADLVLLLPFPYSTLGAQAYASSALSILARLGVVDTLAFGAECEDEELLKNAAKVLCSAAFEEKLKEKLNGEKRAAYAHLRAQTLGEFLPGMDEVLRHPNNILALEYLSEIERCGYGLSSVILPRSPEPSATALRARLGAGELLTEADVPSHELREALAQAGLPQKKLEEALLAALRAGLVCPELSNLGARVADAARRAEDFSDFVMRTKTRKITSARVRRGVLHAYFGVDETSLPEVPYTVLLAANETGRAVLSFIYNIGQIPVYTKPSAPLKEEGEIGRIAALAARADSVYAGFLGRNGDFFLKQGPEIVNKL